MIWQAVILNGTLSTGGPTSWLAVAVVAAGLLGLILGAAVRVRRRV